MSENLQELPVECVIIEMTRWSMNFWRYSVAVVFGKSWLLGKKECLFMV